ncbi:hypothetical protein FOZ60_015393 [Perkinsus olseni]|uniref:Uncharacterized protein n=1 Tax=Perkinsus olseni TaxID=32597 RepID=A0A7J6N608_PEROL|nr:hypothetical protein FOZ60_015393 [Perkinsus olseni]
MCHQTTTRFSTTSSGLNDVSINYHQVNRTTTTADIPVTLLDNPETPEGRCCIKIPWKHPTSRPPPNFKAAYAKHCAITRRLSDEQQRPYAEAIDALWEREVKLKAGQKAAPNDVAGDIQITEDEVTATVGDPNPEDDQEEHDESSLTIQAPSKGPATPVPLEEILLKKSHQRWYLHLYRLRKTNSAEAKLGRFEQLPLKIVEDIIQDLNKQGIQAAGSPQLDAVEELLQD